ncbi:CBS domain-containing protein [Streptomyces sp. NBC_00335]|uniref:CBS domain-containing protein n=1 Tax=unclassified Streptomyces TaxID=2593676 RepID=UPI0022533CC9|nr:MULTISPECIES: CBS domain-containing protein [unclassified Streptomyces]MCX5409201.1 CBS domain-containing protein [Streptomyces sp. NBC_00086]
MKHAKVGFLMTDEVVSVLGGTQCADVAALLVEHDIGGVPVVDADERVLGVISRSDLLTQDRLTAQDLMTAPAVTVHAEQTVTEAARLITRRGVTRLPVIDDEDRLVGIVTRRDLLRVFLRPDREIRRVLVEEVLTDTMGIDADAVRVRVVDGVVTLDGRLPMSGQIPVALRLAGQLDGVVAVIDRLTARSTDSRTRIPPDRGTGDAPL